MMRIDVDFNERDRRGHVVARVPAALAARLVAGQAVNLYDPPEKLWADAVVARVNPETHIAAFDVDWHSFVDAVVVDISDPNSHWSIGVPPSSAAVLIVGISACSSSAAQWALSAVGGAIMAGAWVIVAGDGQAVPGTANALSSNERAAR